MPTPSNRIPVRVARGNKATLDSLIADLFEGELCYAKDEDALYVVEGGALVPVVASTGGNVTSVNSFTGAVVLDADDISDATTTNKYTTQTDIDKLAGISAGAEVNAVDSVNTQTGAVVLDADDISDTSTTNKFATQTELDKLAGIAAGAEVNVNADWNATSGDAQILNKPTIPTNNNQLTNGAGYISDITGENLSDLSDVTVTTPSNGDVLSYNGAAWVNSAAPPADISGSSIGQLNDVDTSTTTPTTNDVLTWTGSEWEPAAPTGGGGATNLGYTASATDGTVTSDTGTDATVPLADGTNAGLLAPGDFSKLGGIAAGAEVNVNADWNAVSGDAQILNKPALAAVATSGAYSDLSGTPSLATVATTGAYSDLTGKPTLGSAAATDSTDYATAAQGTTADSAIQPGDSRLLIAGGTAGQVLEKVDGTDYNVQWATPSGGGGGGALNDLSDVDTATVAPVAGRSLVYDGAEWVPQNAVSGSPALVVTETTTSANALLGPSTAYADINAMFGDGWDPFVSTQGFNFGGTYDGVSILNSENPNRTISGTATNGVTLFGGLIAGAPVLDWATQDVYTFSNNGLCLAASGYGGISSFKQVLSSWETFLPDNQSDWDLTVAAALENNCNSRASGVKLNQNVGGKTWDVFRIDSVDAGNSANTLVAEYWFATDGSLHVKIPSVPNNWITPGTNKAGILASGTFMTGFTNANTFSGLTSAGDYVVQYDVSSALPSSMTLPALAPSSATAGGVLGETRFDANYIYICIAANTWKRSPLSSW